MSNVGADCTRGMVGAAHPMLAGHFPGHPIVPGAWLLAWIVAAAERLYGKRTVVGVKRVKFLRPLAPEQAFECSISLRASDTLRFTAIHAGAVVAEGSLQLQAQQPD